MMQPPLFLEAVIDMIGILLCTKECNLRCKYCFEEEGFKVANMIPESRINAEFYSAMDVWKEFGKQLVAYNNLRGFKTKFTFHGGEPLLIYPEYIDELCAYLRTIDDVEFNVQTNGTIANDKVLKVLKKYDFRVGVSIDGAAITHDENRVNIAGKGSHKAVLENIKKMQQAGISVGAMATITNSITENPKLFYEFYKDNNLTVGFNACYTSPNSVNQSNALDDKKYCAFLKELFDLWIEDSSSSIMIQPFERIMRTIVNPNHGMGVCQFIEDCREVNVAADMNGNIYRCLHYCNIPNSELGNLKNMRLEEIIADFMEQPSHWNLVKDNECKGCDIFNFCYGGCPYWKDAQSITGLEKDFNCTSQKFIVHYIYNRMKESFKNK